MKTTLFTLSLLLCTLTLLAQQDDQAAVQRASLDYIEGFYEGDTTKLTQSVWAAVTKYGYFKGKDKTEFAGEPMSYRQMIDYAKRVAEKKRFPKPDAPKKVVVLNIESNVAATKVTAWWGIDYLLLAKVNGRWMIHQILWQGPLDTVQQQ